MHVDTGDNPPPHMPKTVHITSEALQLGSAGN